MELPSHITKIKRIRARERTVDIWKVHGSLDWFQLDDGQVVSYPLSTKIPEEHIPLIVPPGKDKYSMTHNEPYRTIIASADDKFMKADSYLCIGYGSNDEHIQPKLINEIKKGKAIVEFERKRCLMLVEIHLINVGVNKYVVFESDNNCKTISYGNGWQETYDGEFRKIDEPLKIW